MISGVVKINAEKTGLLRFQNKLCYRGIKLRLHDMLIYYVPTYRYLGVILEHRLNWKSHCEAERAKFPGSLTAQVITSFKVKSISL